MALVKKHSVQEIKELPVFDSLEDVKNYFYSCDDQEQRDYALEEISKFEGGGDFLVDMLNDENLDSQLAAKIASIISNMNPDDAPIEQIMDLLKLDNAYIRNLGISILRDFGDAIKYYIVKFLIGDDRDLRIFAINVLGDVDFAESRDMLVELLEDESDINVAMTAVDFMGEIGEEEDITLLETLKDRFEGDFYAEFAIDNAIRLIKG